MANPRFPGVEVRHARSCPAKGWERCSCKPRYRGVVYSKADKRRIQSAGLATPQAAALTEGKQAYLLRRISSEAAIGKLLFANGLSLMRHMGLTADATPTNLAARRALLMELRGLANVMETMRLSTVALADRLPGSGE